MIGLAPVDAAVLVGYLLLVGGLGLIASRRVGSGEDMNLAGRSMPAWAVGVSILATSLSAVTFIGAPQDAYAGDLTYLSLSLGSVLGAACVAFFFLPRYYRAGVTSVYEIIDETGSPVARRACAVVFLAGRLLASGARLYVAAIPCALIVFGRVDAAALSVSVALLAAVALVYTSAGGIRAVIWTDTLQAAVFLIAALGSVVMLWRAIPLEAPAVLDELRASGDKLRLVNLSGSLDEPYTLWSALIGFTLLNMAAFGTDQDLAQRMLTCRSRARAAASLVGASLAGIVMAGVFLVIGLLLYVAHRTGAMTPGDTGDTRRVFVDFILNETPAGVRGLMLAGLFAAAMSSLDSAVNAMSAAAQREWGIGRSLRGTRLLNAAFGVLLAAAAVVCAHLQQGSEEGLIPFALGVMVYAYAGLLGVFLVVMFTGRGSGASVVCGLLAGAAVVVLLQMWPSWVDETAVRVSLGWRMTAGTIASAGVALLGRRTPRGDAA